ncbi:hypothetical protein INT45_003242 [Circinella minor]|uniref:RlpA-like protein double-psi beta-barrel domain-containing protein n=1 Tax=Circinella minor TaxID=1195481 RepID=A0A8H7SB60_9FUNG|nr:hypothetical protein INT45_003242 [Circinella minor]
MAESYPRLQKRGKKKPKKNNNSDSNIAGIIVADVTDAVNNVVSGFFDGWATFFHPATEGGKYGACYGYEESDHSNIVALSSDLYGDTSKNSRWCGRTVYIETEDGRSTTANITDACPTCKGRSLDLTPAVFNRIANPKDGIVRIRWCTCGTKGCDADACK